MQTIFQKQTNIMTTRQTLNLKSQSLHLYIINTKNLRTPLMDLFDTILGVLLSDHNAN